MPVRAILILLSCFLFSAPTDLPVFHTLLLLETCSEAFAYVNVARLAAPLRIAFALSSTSWVQENLLDRFGVKSKNDNKEEENYSFDKASEKL